MNVGILGNGNIAKIIKKEVNENKYFKVNKETIKKLDWVIITWPAFIINRESEEWRWLFKNNSYKKVVIPGNGLNELLLSNRFDDKTIWVSATPYIGRFDGVNGIYHKRDNIMVSSESLEMEKLFKVPAFVSKSNKIYASNVWMHPIRFMEVYEKKLNNVKFYDFSTKCATKMKKYDSEISEMIFEIYGVQVESGFEHFDVKDPWSFSKKIASIKTLNEIKIDGTRPFDEQRYFLDDIDYKLRYLYNHSKIKNDYPETAALIQWADKIKKEKFKLSQNKK